VPLASIILGFSFIFGNSAATLFNSVRVILVAQWCQPNRHDVSSSLYSRLTSLTSVTLC
jgi:hypothetical protein